jgi:acetyl esterase/lipase
MKQLLTILISSFLLVQCVKDDKTNNNINTGGSNLTDTILMNVAYGSHSRNIMDLHLPAKRDNKTPVMVFIHGGAWKAGDKADLNNYVNIIKKEWPSIAIANINYRYASNDSNIHHPQMMDDIKKAIGFLVNKKADFQISTDMSIGGGSAGGQLAMIYAYKYNDYNNIKCVLNIFGPSSIRDWSWYQSNNIWLGGKVGDILAEYVGQQWDSTAYAQVSPLQQVDSNTPPTIIFHGNLDPIVPFYQSQWLNAELGKNGVAKEFHEYLAFHSFDGPQTNDVCKKMVAFMKKHM